MSREYIPPDRCSLTQAALWYVNKIDPLPDKIFNDAPLSLDCDPLELRQLFVTMRQFDCNLIGKLFCHFVHSDPYSTLGTSRIYPALMVSNDDYELLARVPIEFVKLEAVDFENSKIVLENIEYFFNFPQNS